jgi:hypothetical protein
MELSTPLEAASCDTIQELSSILWKPKFITEFARALYWSLSRERSIQSIPLPTYL